MVPQPTSGDSNNLDDITSLQSQLNIVSQRQDELTQLVGVLRRQHGRIESGPLNSIRARTALSQGSIEIAHPAGETRGESFIPRIPSSQFQGPHCHHIGSNGQTPIHPVPPPQHPIPPLPPSVPVFSQLHDRAGHVIGLVHQGSFSLLGCRGTGTCGCQTSQGWTQIQACRPQECPQIHPQSQSPSHILGWAQGPVPVSGGEPPGPIPAFSEPTPGKNQPCPSTPRHGASGTLAMLQPQSPSNVPNNGPENKGETGDGPASGRKRTASGSMRAVPPRKKGFI